MGESDFRIKSELARKRGWDYGEPKTLDEVKEWAEGQREVVPSVAPPTFNDDEEFFSTFEVIPEDYFNVELLFGGGPHYIDTVYVQYNDVSDVEAFREFMVVHFKDWLDPNPEDNEGICPLCDDRITTGDFHRLGEDVLFRSNTDDPELWASPDEFDFREYPDYGKVCRMWWD